MKIFYYEKMYNTPMYQWQNVHFIDELSRHGIEIDIFNSLNKSEDVIVDEINRKLDSKHYVMFMTGLGDKDVPKGVIELVKSKEIPTLLICFDNLLAPYMHRNICSEFDLVWLTSFENEELFSRWGAKCIVQPYAANPYYFKYKSRPITNSVCFIGSTYGSRANTINQIASGSIYVDVFNKRETERENDELAPIYKKTIKNELGHFFTCLKYPIGRKVITAAIKQKFVKEASIDYSSDFVRQFKSPSFEEMSDIYSEYAVALSSTTARSTGILKNPVNIINLRSFEIPMSGGVQICKKNKEMESYFENRKEILMYEDDEELLDIIRFYLKPQNSELVVSMKKAARKRAEECHTWYNRFSVIFSNLGIIGDETK